MPTDENRNSDYRYITPDRLIERADRAAQAAADAAIGKSEDPFNWANIWEAMSNMLNKGSRGSGGGGYGASAASKKAYGQMLANLNAQAGANAKTFSDREAMLRDALSGGESRLTGILNDLTAGAARTRGDVASAYSGGQEALARLGNEIAQQEANRAYGLGQTQAMFGGSPQAIDRNYGAVDTVNAQRGMLAGQAGAADAMYANRGNVYNGLMGDVRTKNSQAFDALLAQLSAQKQQQALADANAKAQLGIQAAQSGVTL